jgi:hypothetical protein
LVVLGFGVGQPGFGGWVEALDLPVLHALDFPLKAVLRAGVDGDEDERRRKQGD